MSILLDKIFKECSNNVEINGRWYIAKDTDFYLNILNIFTPFGFSILLNRIKDAYRVLIGKSRAFHYKEDEE